MSPLLRAASLPAAVLVAAVLASGCGPTAGEHRRAAEPSETAAPAPEPSYSPLDRLAPVPPGPRRRLVVCLHSGDEPVDAARLEGHFWAPLFVECQPPEVAGSLPVTPAR